MQAKVFLGWPITVWFTKLFLCHKRWEFWMQKPQWTRNGKSSRQFQRETWEKSRAKRRLFWKHKKTEQESPLCDIDGHTGCFAILGRYVDTGANLGKQGVWDENFVSRHRFARLGYFSANSVVHFSSLSSALAKSWGCPVSPDWGSASAKGLKSWCLLSLVSPDWCLFPQIGSGPVKKPPFQSLRCARQLTILYEFLRDFFNWGVLLNFCFTPHLQDMQNRLVQHHGTQRLVPWASRYGKEHVRCLTPWNPQERTVNFTRKHAKRRKDEETKEMTWLLNSLHNIFNHFLRCAYRVCSNHEPPAATQAWSLFTNCPTTRPASADENSSKARTVSFRKWSTVVGFFRWTRASIVDQTLSASCPASPSATSLAINNSTLRSRTAFLRKGRPAFSFWHQRRIAFKLNLLNLLWISDTLKPSTRRNEIRWVSSLVGDLPEPMLSVRMCQLCIKTCAKMAGSILHLYVGVCWCGVSCLTITVRYSWNDVHYFGCRHLWRQMSLVHLRHGIQGVSPYWGVMLTQAPIWGNRGWETKFLFHASVSLDWGTFRLTPLCTFPHFPRLWLRVGVALFPQIGVVLRRKVWNLDVYSHLFHPIGACFPRLGWSSQKKHLFRACDVQDNWQFCMSFLREFFNWRVLPNFCFTPPLQDMQNRLVQHHGTQRLVPWASRYGKEHVRCLTPWNPQERTVNCTRKHAKRRKDEETKKMTWLLNSLHNIFNHFLRCAYSLGHKNALCWSSLQSGPLVGLQRLTAVRGCGSGLGFLTKCPNYSINTPPMWRNALYVTSKNAESEPKLQKYTGRVLLWGDIVKDDSGAYAVFTERFTEQGSSPSQMTAAKSTGCYSEITRLWWTSSWRRISIHSGKRWRMLPHCSKFLSQTVQTYGYVFRETNGQNPVTKLKILWYFLNEIIMVIH